MDRSGQHAQKLPSDDEPLFSSPLNASLSIEVEDASGQQPLANFLAPRTLLIITALFWAYIAVSNILYAQGMRINVARFTSAMVFSPPGERVIQHVILFPLLLGCYWASLRLGWRRADRMLLQLILASWFAALSYWAMDLAEYVYFTAVVHVSADEMAANKSPFNGALMTVHFTSFLLTYGFGLALVTGIALYRRFHRAELRMSALEREWGVARLSALRMQLSPHTLFNLLHTIRGQINFDPEAAREMVVQLADLLRRLLGAGQREFSRLSEELQFARLYLELQQQRFSDRLTIVLPDEDAVPPVWVPSLILQPLVENAVVHGLTGHEDPVEVRIETSLVVAEDILIMRVNNAVSRVSASGGEGIGLSNVRERLFVQFGRRAQLTAGHTRPGSWVAEVRMPVLREMTRPQKMAARGVA